MATLFKSKGGRIPDYYDQKNKTEQKLGYKISNAEFEEKYLVLPKNNSTLTSTGTSIFDPALCELIYLWFSKEGDSVIDPFAGGSVRGIVAAELGRSYVGVDIRQEQIDANNQNADEICTDIKPAWVCGDSMNIQDIAKGEYDFMLTCPPYGDLEVYSDDPADISNMDAEDFDKTYTEILQKTVQMLKQDRFCAIVVGNYRDKKGYMRDLCGLTVRAMEFGGARYYNDIVYVTPSGALRVTAGIPFKKSRKVGKIHQNLLVFCKGDPRKATTRLGDVQIPDLEEFTDESLED